MPRLDPDIDPARILARFDEMTRSTPISIHWHDLTASIIWLEMQIADRDKEIFLKEISRIDRKIIVRKFASVGI